MTIVLPTDSHNALSANKVVLFDCKKSLPSWEYHRIRRNSFPCYSGKAAPVARPQDQRTLTPPTRS